MSRLADRLASVLAIQGPRRRRTTPAQRLAMLMPHTERQALIRRPFPVAYYPPAQRHGGVMIIDDETWMRDANAWRKKYAQDTPVQQEDSI